MASALGERTIADATSQGNAILKFISPNDAGVTGSHQAGFYLPKPVWHMYTPHPPERGHNAEEFVEITWQDGRVTRSRIVWYGQETRAEYRLTRFGRGFPFLNADTVGDLFVLIPHDHHHFTAYILDLDEDIEELQAALGVEPFENWGVYQGGIPRVETENECVEREFRAFAEMLAVFPPGETFSAETIRILEECSGRFQEMNADDLLMRSMETEYSLFRFVERRICQPDIARLFRDVDDFLQTAATIMNRRKSRAGRSLENHVHYLLDAARIPHTMRSQAIPGKPDVVIPSEEAYFDGNYPEDRIFIVGVKTTCKDRWRQVLNEGRRVRTKHIFTIQPGISTAQLAEMHEAGVKLIVPHRLHRDYPADREIELLNIRAFIDQVRQAL
ncbi:MAG: type II restriction endonuclease [Gemmatimonadaceae bacterium]